VDKLGPGEWVLGGRWSTDSWADPTQPTRNWVDDVTGDRPLYLSRMDGHSALANSAALRLAGIDKAGPDNPEGGVIERHAQTGEPTGILRESAMDLVAQHIPPTTLQQKVAALERAMVWANRHGITAVGDIPDIDDLPAYEELARGKPTVRFFLYPYVDDWGQAIETVDSFHGREDWVEVRGLKAYLDGTLGSRTAYMHEPFCGNPPEKESWRGLLREGVADGRFARNAKMAQRAGLQSIAHAIGDEANHVLLGTLAQAYPDLRRTRCRSEHAQHLLPEDIPRFAELGVIASMQPYHKADDGRYAEDYIGPQRCRSSYAFKSLLDAGAVVAFGSDWPVVSLNPFLGVETAVTGRTLDGHRWQTQENLTVGEALRGYTSRAAYALFADERIGRIAVGLRADFVVLSQSLFAASPEWSAIRPVAVFLDGREVFSHP
jgi:predicted amidohydrolase YtcJ